MPDQFPFIYRLATGFFRHLLFPLKGRVSATSTERVPREGGVLVASVHMSHLDAPAMAATLKFRRLRAMAKEELWKNKLFGKIIEGIGAFPIKRGEGDMESVKKCIAYLKAGEAVIVFVEGTRNDGLRMLPLTQGIALLAKKSGAAVVPVGISGTQIIMPAGGGNGRKHPVKVVYGEPMYYADFATGSSEKESRALFLAELEKRILSLTSEAGTTLKSASSS